jgi:hypothetical protein
MKLAGLTYHATTVTHRGGRRITDRIGTRQNLCGAAATLKDVLRPDFRKMYGSKEWPGGCAACAQALGLEASR